MRKFSISLLAVVAVLAMFLGNCLSCPLMLAGAASHQPAHSCCHKPQPASATCHTQDMQPFVQAGTPASAAPPVAVLAELPAAPVVPAQRVSVRPANLDAPPGESRCLRSLRV